MAAQKDGTDILCPIQLILDDANYLHWAQQMHRFLQGRRLWGYVSGSIKAPSRTDVAFEDNEADWVAENSKIISWFSDTSLHKINQLFGPFDTAKEVWDYLAATNTVSDLASQYQIDLDLHRLRQIPGQSIQDYYSQLAILWDKQTHPSQCTNCLVHYSHSRDSKQLRQFFIGLLDDYEDRRSSLLNRNPTPTLAAALAEKKSEEVRKKTAAILALPSSNQNFEMKDLGDLRYFLGLEVASHHTGYFLSQIKYASDLVSKSGVSLSDIVMSPMEENWEHSTLTGEPLSDLTYYRQLVGSLIYLTVTRPDIAYAFHRGTLSHGLHYPSASSLQLTAYSDAY
ncbi:hypothetical protein RJ639_040152 [Escallonia herrerae]|uniref:Retrotransposon Copia-like N-terminal domain-containing protein n=1 Tax=Escallonia herrerae TaxID=1293975 RepID=A0AA88WS83_9ASTE|nr:hypothetical protein RJ639_040152 [Escallonia herrerae]